MMSLQTIRLLIKKCLLICDDNIILSHSLFCIKVQFEVYYVYNFMFNTLLYKISVQFDQLSKT